MYQEKNLTVLPEKTESCEIQAMSARAHPAFSHGTKTQEKEWKKTLKELRTEERASDVNLRDAFSKYVWWQRTCSQASHG